LIPETIEQPDSPNSDELCDALAAILARHRVPGLAIIALERRPSAYRSSFPLEEIQLALNNGSALDLIFKNLSRQSLHDTVRQAKPEFLDDPLREIETYQTLLAAHQPELGTARCFGAVTDSSIERYWLFLEKVPGDELYMIGEFSTWESTARWLAGMHQKFASQIANPASRSPHWLNHNADYYRTWMHRAQELCQQTPLSRPATVRRDIARIARQYDKVVERLTDLPVTFIHGEFYASNVLIERCDPGLRVCPIDWEMAAVGPGLVDLAALVSGRWTDGQRTAMALAYFEALTDENVVAPRRPESFLAALDDCRLHLAVQWLGWSNQWSPPSDHAQDWLVEALHLAEKVGCLS
jgi:thiamine kinase-like enzyme